MSKKGEKFVPQHTLSFQISGKFTLAGSNQKHVADKGDFHSIRKSQLVKFTKSPPENGVFESLNILIGNDVLLEMVKGYHISTELHTHQFEEPLTALNVNDVLQNYITSLQTYFLDNKSFLTSDFIDLKIKNLLFILIRTQPKLKHILFEFL